MEPAFNDLKTHQVNEKGNVVITRRHLLPKNKKRIRRAPNRLNL